jgi:uncharacterized membrane protein YdbT with pleckstrin-like domain
VSAPTGSNLDTGLQVVGPSSPSAPAASGALAPAQGSAPTLGERTIFEGAPALVPSIGAAAIAVLTLGLAVAYFWWKRGGTHYRVTNQRIVITRGLLGKRMEQLDLYRIHDYSVDRPFGQRILGTGNLRLSTFDKTTPAVELLSLKTDVERLYEELRQAVELIKQQRGVRMVDYEQS